MNPDDTMDDLPDGTATFDVDLADDVWTLVPCAEACSEFACTGAHLANDADTRECAGCDMTRVGEGGAESNVRSGRFRPYTGL